MTVRADALAAVDNQWRRANDIHRRMEMWHPRSAREALIALMEAGEIERRTVPHPGGNIAHEYRRLQKVDA